MTDLHRVPQHTALIDPEVTAAVHACVSPSREFERGSAVPRQERQEGFEPIRIETHERRELPQDGAELLVEREHSRREEVRERLFDAAELQHVRDEAWTLHGEHEIRRRIRVPLPPALRPLQRIEAAIELDRRKPLGGELELGALG